MGLVLSAAAPVSASRDDQTEEEGSSRKGWITAAELQVRADWQRDWVNGGKRARESGFKGQYLQFIIKGDLNSHFSYAYRQRFSKGMNGGSFFDATDWLYLTYRPTKRLCISAGKEIVQIGGWEYDAPPIDIYQYTEYCSQLSCYEFGSSITYDVTGHDQLLLQASQSPFRKWGADMYAFNLKWTGNHGFWHTLYSVSLLEYKPGSYINYIALGNKFRFPHGFFLLDYTNRYAGGQGTRFLEDFTLSGELHVRPVGKLNIFTKYGFDYNQGNHADRWVWAGTRQHHLGFGAEFFPMKNREDIRLHANWFRTWGHNTNTEYGFLQDRQQTLNIGVTLKADLLNAKKYFKK